MTVDVDTVQRWANTIGVVTLLVLTLIGGYKQWWVFGWLYKDLVKDRDDWKALALKGTNLAERALDVPPPKT